MARTTWHLTVALMTTGLLGTAAPVLGGDAGGTPLRRVRSSSGPIVALINQAAERSATFRRLIETIDASDGIVYVEEGKCSRGVRACFVSVADAGQNRLLRVIIDARRAEWDLIGSIGHELRHAIEVLETPRVRSSVQMHFFYAREGERGTSKGTFETPAAVDAGDEVRREILTYRRQLQGK
jgi:hypothetical protein